MPKRLYMSFMAFGGTSVISFEVYAVYLRFLSTESDGPKTYPSFPIFMWIIFTTQVAMYERRTCLLKVFSLCILRGTS